MAALRRRMDRWMRLMALALILALGMSGTAMGEALSGAEAVEEVVVSTGEEEAVSEAKGFELNDAEATSVKHTLRIGSDTTYAVNVGDTLEVSFQAGAIRTFSSKKPKVADVVDMECSSGMAWILAKREGTAKMKAKLASGKKISLKLVVKDPTIPKSVSLGGGSLTVSVGETLTLSPTLYPSTAQTTYRWSSDKKKVATVSADGVVTPLKEGKTKITVKTANGKKASVTVKVVDPNKPDSVYLSDAFVEVGGVALLEPTLIPAGAVTVYTWSISDKKVASLSADGVLIGLKAGKATVTVKTANGKKATCKVTVQGGSDEGGEGGSDPETPSVTPAPTTPGVKYRALLVSNDNFYLGEELGWERTKLNQSASNSMKAMLKKVSGPQGGSFTVTQKKELTRDTLKSAIEAAFAGADEDDVSLFYFASHGDSFSTGSDAGALVMASLTTDYPDYVKLSELRDWLLNVPGKVIVLLDSCGSGAAVYKKGAGGVDWRAVRRDCEAFDAEAVRVFAEADPGIAPKTGELRVSNKFYVLCSSRYREDSWAYEDDSSSGSYFTDWLVEGVGRSGSMPADARYSGNGNGVVDLYELYKYISAVGDSFSMFSFGDEYYQHVQVYPSDTRFELFK